MRKKFLFAAMAVAALASCSNDDVVDVNKGEGISFRASLDRSTRANVTNLQNLQKFNVTAIGNGDRYFENLAVTSSDNGTTWTTAPTYYYWPSYQLAFFAYSPQTPGGTVGITNAEKKITGFSPAQAVADQKDLVISYNTGTKGNQNDGVPMNFKHALSQIEVKAKCSNDKIKIEVIGVKLENAAAKADFTFPEEETNTAYTLPQNKWSNWSEKDVHEKAYMVHGADAVTLDATPKSIMFGDNNFMLIPQKLTAWAGTEAKTGAYLSVLCRISSLNGNDETLLYPQPTNSDTKDGKYAFAAVGISTDWLPGKKYTYTLNFCAPDGGAGQIDPNPTTPTPITNGPTVDPTPKPDGKGGDPVLNKPIKFTVTVDNWVDAPQEIDL